MPRHTEKAHETLGLTGETQIVALADFHGRFDNHHQPWWVWALTGQARKNPDPPVTALVSNPILVRIVGKVWGQWDFLARCQQHGVDDFSIPYPGATDH